VEERLRFLLSEGKFTIMYDKLLVTQVSQTVTNSATGTAIDLKTGTPRRGLKARFICYSYSNASGNATVTPIIEVSNDNATWQTLTSGDPLTTSTTAQTNEQFLSFETSKRYVRGSVVFSTTVGTPACTYAMDIGTARP
jgi:hypothetical protein